MVAGSFLATLDWDAIREWATAIGTIGAASFAGYAALTSRDSAQAAERAAQAAEKQAEISREQVATAREEIEVARRALQAQTQPVLIDEPVDLSREEQYDFREGPPMTVHPGGVIVAPRRLSMPVRNMGRGPAHITGVGVRMVNQEGSRIAGPSCDDITRSVLPVGETARLNFSIREEDMKLTNRWDTWLYTIESYRSLSILVRYSDLAENPDFISHFILRWRDQGHYNWQISQVLVYPAAEVEAEEREYAARAQS